MTDVVPMAFRPLVARHVAANAVVGLLVEDRELVVVTAIGHHLNGGTPGVAKDHILTDEALDQIEFTRRIMAALVPMEASAVVDELDGLGWAPDELERMLAEMVRPSDPEAVLELAHDAAEAIVEHELALIDTLTNALVERPTLLGSEVEAIVGEDAARRRWRYRPVIDALVAALLPGDRS